MAAQSARSAVNSLLAPVHNIASAFFTGIKTMALTLLFLFVMAVIVVPLGHHVFSYWQSAVASWQGPAKAAVKR